MDKEELKQLYPLIAKKHPRTDLEPIHEVKLYIVQEARRKREITAREIWIEIKRYAKGVIDNAVKLLSEFGYITKKRRGSGFFFTEEKKNGEFGERYYTEEDIKKVQKEKSLEVKNILTKNKNLLKGEVMELYKKLLKKENINLNSYNKLVELLWSEGFSSLVKLSFKSGAYRYTK